MCVSAYHRRGIENGYGENGVGNNLGQLSMAARNIEVLEEIQPKMKKIIVAIMSGEAYQCG
jgi:hypothetical protein